MHLVDLDIHSSMCFPIILKSFRFPISSFITLFMSNHDVLANKTLRRLSTKYEIVRFTMNCMYEGRKICVIHNEVHVAKGLKILLSHTSMY